MTSLEKSAPIVNDGHWISGDDLRAWRNTLCLAQGTIRGLQRELDDINDKMTHLARELVDMRYSITKQAEISCDP